MRPHSVQPERSTAWGSITQQSHLSYPHAAILWFLQLQAKSEHSLACIVLSRVEASLRNMVEGSRLASAMSKIFAIYCIYTTVSPRTLTEQMLCFSCLSRMLSPKHNCYLSYNKCARSGCHSWPSFTTIVQLTQSIKLYENFTYTPHVARGYCVKLRCQEYTERHTTENIYAIEHTSVGLAHACPN